MKNIFTLILGLFLSYVIQANGIRITNLSTTYNSGTQVATVNFDLSWDNSWRNAYSNNWDAAWVFFKFNNGGSWTHLNLTGNDITLPSGITSKVSSDKTGIMIYRDSIGQGNLTLTGCKVGVTTQWGNYDIKGFALEMVYIPTGSYYAGDGFSTSRFQNGNASYRPFRVTSNSLTMGTSAGQLYDPIGGGFSGSLASTYPNGYDSFYVMKYELSWGGYRDFLNTLSFTAQQSRTGKSPASGANGNAFTNGVPSYRTKILKIKTNGVSPSTPAVYGCDEDNDNVYDEGNDGEFAAADSLSWTDLAAYMDWSGLRPITELEYEKASRGIDSFEAGEYAWGSIGYQGNVHNYINTGTDSEKVSIPVTQGMTVFNNTNYGSNMIANTHYGALRNGVFGNSTTNRPKSGASYYGVMEMSGNVLELVVNVWGAAGRSYTGKHGNGSLDASGNADVDFWPGINGNTNPSAANSAYAGISGVTGFAGHMFKGGCYADAINSLRISDRSNANPTSTNRVRGYGIRGGRSL